MNDEVLYRQISRVIHDALNLVHEEIDEFSNVPVDDLAEMVSEAAAEYINMVYDEVAQREYVQ